MSTASPDFTDIEDLLIAAGIGFTVVDRCPYPACEVCGRRVVPAAA